MVFILRSELNQLLCCHLTGIILAYIYIDCLITYWLDINHVEHVQLPQVEHTEAPGKTGGSLLVFY